MRLRYRVVSEFTASGQRIKPPGEWTAPSQEVADRLIAAGCLAPARNRTKPAGTDEPEEVDEESASETQTEEQQSPQRSRKGRRGKSRG